MRYRVMTLFPAKASMIEATASASPQRVGMVREPRNLGGPELKSSDKAPVSRARGMT